MSYQAIGVLTAAILYQLSRIYTTNLALRKHLKTLKYFLQLIPLSPSDLIKEFSSGCKSKVAICHGTIIAGEKCRAILNSAQQIVYSKLVYSAIMRLQDSWNKTKSILRIKRPSFLRLKDLQEPAKQVLIYETTGVKTSTTKIIPYLSYNRFSQMGFFRFLFNYIFNVGDPAFQEIKQYILPSGEDCLIYGQFIRQASGQVCCYSPTMISPIKSKIDTFLQSEIFLLKAKKAILIVSTLGCAAFLIRQIYRFVKNYEKKQEDELENIKKVEVRSRICQNCKAQLSNMLNKPCLHMNLCKKCSSEKDYCIECSRAKKKQIELYVC